MFCIECGSAMKSGSRFCSTCGTTVAQDAQPRSAGTPANSIRPSFTAGKLAIVVAAGVVAITVVGLYFTQSGLAPKSKEPGTAGTPSLLQRISKPSYPEAYGIYLVHSDGRYERFRTNDEVKQIDRGTETPVAILIYDKRLAVDTNALKVIPGYFVRKFRKNHSMRGNLPIENFRSWMTIDSKSTPIPGQFTPVKDRPDTVVWTPTSEIKPGVFYIKVSSTSLSEKPLELEPFFYKKSAALQNLEQGDICVDYYQYFGDSPRFYPCRDNYSGQ